MRLIDADAFKEYIKDGIDGLILPKDQAVKVIAITKSFLKDIDEQPTVEARPHGEWIIRRDKQGAHIYSVCSKCNVPYLDTDFPNFCPNCGADMRKSGEPK